MTDSRANKTHTKTQTQTHTHTHTHTFLPHEAMTRALRASTCVALPSFFSFPPFFVTRRMWSMREAVSASCHLHNLPTRERERERVRDRDRETEKERERERQRGRGWEGEREIDRQREKERERERGRECLEAAGAAGN